MTSPIIKKCLRILDFENLDQVPLMKEVRKRFFHLSIQKHPDKNDGVDKGFGELKSAYDILCKFINENTEFDSADEEEVLTRKQFAEANIVIMNKESITVKVSSMFIPFYEKILEEQFGSPTDQSDSNNGKKYKAENEVYITTYHKKKESHSTVFVQGRKYMSFVENDLPKIFRKVLDSLPLSLRLKCEQPRKRKRTEKPENDIQCEECPQAVTNKKELTRHKIMCHTKTKTKKNKKVKISNNISGPLLVKLKETVSEEINKSMSNLLSTLSPQKEPVVESGNNKETLGRDKPENTNQTKKKAVLTADPEEKESSSFYEGPSVVVVKDIIQHIMTEINESETEQRKGKEIVDTEKNIGETSDIEAERLQVEIEVVEFVNNSENEDCGEDVAKETEENNESDKPDEVNLCHVCGEIFQQREFIKNHIKDMHAEEDENPKKFDKKISNKFRRVSQELIKEKNLREHQQKQLRFLKRKNAELGSKYDALVKVVEEVKLQMQEQFKMIKRHNSDCFMEKQIKRKERKEKEKESVGESKSQEKGNETGKKPKEKANDYPVKQNKKIGEDKKRNENEKRKEKDDNGKHSKKKEAASREKEDDRNRQTKPEDVLCTLCDFKTTNKEILEKTYESCYGPQKETKGYRMQIFP